MKETEDSVPLERLAGSMPFQGLRKPPALPGGLTFPFRRSLGGGGQKTWAKLGLIQLLRTAMRFF